MTEQPQMTAAKTIAAAIGATATAITTAVATAQLVLADGKLDLTEYGTVTVALLTLVTSIYAVWRTPNHVVEPPASSSHTDIYRNRY